MPRYLGSKTSLIEKLRRAASRASVANPRLLGVMSSPPTVTTVSATAPAGQTNVYTLAANAGVFRVSGGEIYTSGTHAGKVRSSIIAATGGNLSVNDGSTGSYSRIEFQADAAVVVVAVKARTIPYRFIVDGQYVDLTGTVTSVTSGSQIEYIVLTFAARALRTISLEMQQTEAFVGVNVGPTEKVYSADGRDIIKSVLLGDSYPFGSTASNLADGFGAVMADWLGLRQHTNSGSSGTGWATVSSYSFSQRIDNGDLGLGGAPEIIFLMASYNDRGLVAATIQANADAGLRKARELYPNALIVVLGCFPALTGPSAGILAAEASVFAAVDAIADPFTVKVPISTRPEGALITGTGRIGATTGTGNSDIYTDTDGVHPPTAGHAFIGKWAAGQVLAAVNTLAA